MTVRVLRSPADRRNPQVVELLRKEGEGNDAWLRRAVEGRYVETGPEWSLLLLVGGTDPLSFRLRVAQSHVRHDLSPSAWSHVLFIPRLEPKLAESRTREVSLAPSACFGEHGFPLPTNGLQRGRLETYLADELFPNLAVLSVPVPATDLDTSLTGLQGQRSILDVPQLILRWLAYCWGVGVPSSPLAEGLGVPGAALLEAAFSARDFDLTPGLESRSSCPEAIWQAATWWHGFYQRTQAGRAIRGAYCSKHELVPDKFFGGSPPQVTAPPPPAKRRERTPRRT
jgi:hypothetical protein